MVDPSTTPLLAAAAALAGAALAEVLHARRTRRVARLAFGLATLLLIEPHKHSGAEEPSAPRPGEVRHVLLVLDVSPSMRLEDAGPTHEQSRMHRASDVLESFFRRVPLELYRISVIAVYNGAKPVVEDTSDVEVVRNILGDLPLHFAFETGKTKLFDGLEEAARLAAPWNPRSTTLLVVSDGDTVPAKGMPRMPPSVRDTVVIGVGDPVTGRFIDGRQSRQDVSTLRQIAARLGGTFHNGNELHLSSSLLGELTSSEGEGPLQRLGRREYALIAAGAGAACLALLPFLLHLFGTAWRPGVRTAFKRAALDSSGRSGGRWSLKGDSAA